MQDTGVFETHTPFKCAKPETSQIAHIRISSYGQMEKKGTSKKKRQWYNQQTTQKK